MSSTIYLSINIESSTQMFKLVHFQNVKQTRKGHVTLTKIFSHKEINIISHKYATYVRTEKECHLPFSYN